LGWGTSAKSPITGLPYIVMGLGNDVNMLPNSDYDREVFNEYKQAFNDLIKVDLYKDANGTDWSI
jgi:hypothetical protein